MHILVYIDIHAFGLFSMCATSLVRPRIAQGGWMEWSGQFREVLQYWRWEESWMTANMYQQCCFVGRSSNPNHKHLPESDFSILGIPKNWYKFLKILVFVRLFAPPFFVAAEFSPERLSRTFFRTEEHPRPSLVCRSQGARTWAMEMLPSSMGDYKLQYISHYI